MKIANNGLKLLTERGKTRLKNHKKMNLYDRLKPEIKKAIEQREKKFPLILEELTEELKEKESIFLMTYGNFIELEFIVRFHTNLNPDKPLEFFVK